jgi:hypothetical protein
VLFPSFVAMRPVGVGSRTACASLQTTASIRLMWCLSSTSLRALARAFVCSSWRRTDATVRWTRALRLSPLAIFQGRTTGGAREAHTPALLTANGCEAPPSGLPSSNVSTSVQRPAEGGRLFISATCERPGDALVGAELVEPKHELVCSLPVRLVCDAG